MAEDSRALRLQQAAEGYDDLYDRLGNLERGERTDVRNIVRFLRGIPTGDGPKKRELAEYFQTEDGQRYTKEERFAAYNDLLGTHGNRESRG